MITPPRNLYYKTFIKFYILRQIEHCPIRSDTIKSYLSSLQWIVSEFFFFFGALAHLFVACHLFNGFITAEKISKSWPDKAGYWHGGNQANRLQSRWKPCQRDKQEGKSLDLCTLLCNFLITFANMNFNLNYITASNLIQLTPFSYPRV